MNIADHPSSGYPLATCRHIAVYVTNHGFGHINRVVAVLNQVRAEVRITVRGDRDIWEPLKERLNREVEFGYFPSDQGTVCPPGQNSQTDWPATFERLARRYTEIQSARTAEMQWIKTSGVDCIYADASPIPMRMAAEAGLPGFLGANFTWNEIYGHLLETAPVGLFSGEQVVQFQSIVDQMQSACRSATLLRFWPHTPMIGIGANIIDVGLVVNEARDIRRELLERFHLKPDVKLIYFYVGRYGVEELPWKKLNEFPDDMLFIGLHPPGLELPGRFFQVDPNEFCGADLLKAADAAIAKAGYGAVAEAMAVNTPVIYPPRETFIEFPALDGALRGWSGGFPVSEADFNSLNFQKTLYQALATTVEPPPVPLDGAARVARFLEGNAIG